jgi:TP901 family phage tail tape measure protein
MGGNEWVIKVTADVKGVLDASRQIGEQGKQAGKQFKDGFSGSDQTLNGLRGRLNELNQTLEKSTIGSKEFAATQREIAQAQKQVDSALVTGTGIVNTFGVAIKGALLQFAALAGAYEAITFIGKAVVGLDSAGAAVRTLGVDSKELSDDLLNLSIELGSNISQVDLLKASYDVASSGFSTTAEITDILRASTLGAKGGFAELNDVAKALTAVINAYGLTSKDASQVVDSFVQTQADGVITVKQFSDNIGTVASVAAAAGIPFKELSAAISTATLKGVPVEQTFTGLRQAISSILKPSEEAKTLARSLGISFDLAGLKASGFGGLLADVQLKTGGAADKIAILLGSVEAQAAIQPILNDSLKTYNEQLGNQRNKSDQAAEASKIATETIAGGFNQIINALTNLGAAFNTAIPQAGSLFSGLAKLIEVGAKIIIAIGPAIGKSLVQAFLPLVGLANATGFDKLIDKSLDWLLGVNAGSKAITTEQEKQKQVQAQVNAKQEEQKAIAGEILNNKRSQNLEDQVANQNAQKLQEAYSNLAKAQIDAQVKVGQAGVNLGQALISLEDSRFGIIRNRNSFELKDAQERKVSEFEIDAIKRRGEAIEVAALNFKYNTLLQQQTLQRSLVALQQEQARQEADAASVTSRLEVKQKELTLQNAILSGNATAQRDAAIELEKAQIGVTIADSKLQILAQTQPIQAQIAAAADEEARNRIIGDAAAKGLALSADDTFKATKGTADQFKSIGDSLKVPLNQQTAFAQLAKDVGLQVKDTGKGYVEIGQSLSRSSAPAANDIKDSMKLSETSTRLAKNQAAGLADNMKNAADEAGNFYSALARASGLPEARFTGGPVAAGQTYHVNDGPSGMSLGQEAFLSASGALSLINRPMNSLWTAPSRGTVIPAAITSRLKGSGALGGGAGMLRGGSDPAMAHLSLAVGNLSQEVAELRRKAWNVSVGVRGDGSGLKLAQTMARMR